MQKRVVGLGVLVAVLMVGCAPSSPIVGKWNGSVESNGQTMTTVIEYKADKSYDATMTIPGAEVPIKMTGTYEFKDGKLTSTTKEMKLGGELPASLKPMQSMIEDSMKKAEGQKATVSVEFKDDTMTQTPEQGGRGMTFTKVKS